MGGAARETIAPAPRRRRCRSRRRRRRRFRRMLRRGHRSPGPPRIRAPARPCRCAGRADTRAEDRSQLNRQSPHTAGAAVHKHGLSRLHGGVVDQGLQGGQTGQRQRWRDCMRRRRRLGGQVGRGDGDELIEGDGSGVHGHQQLAGGSDRRGRRLDDQLLGPPRRCARKAVISVRATANRSGRRPFSPGARWRG